MMLTGLMNEQPPRLDISGNLEEVENIIVKFWIRCQELLNCGSIVPAFVSEIGEVTRKETVERDDLGILTG
jgi:hypothetical protein